MQASQQSSIGNGNAKKADFYKSRFHLHLKLCCVWKKFWTQADFLVSPLESADEDLPMVVDELASMVAVSGDQVEQIARARNVGEETLA